MSDSHNAKFLSLLVKAVVGAAVGFAAFKVVKRIHKKRGCCAGRKERKCCGRSCAGKDGSGSKCHPKCCARLERHHQGKHHGGEGHHGCPARKCPAFAEKFAAYDSKHQTAAAGSGGSASAAPASAAAGADSVPQLPKNTVVPTVARLPVFCSATVIGKTIYTSGILGTTPIPASGDGKFALVEGGIRPETRQVMDNIATILQHVISANLPAGKSLPANYNVWSSVGKMNVYLRDSTVEAYTSMNEEYSKYFAGVATPAARMTSAGVTLARGAAVEIEAIAQLPFHEHEGKKKWLAHHFGGPHHGHGFGFGGHKHGGGCHGGGSGGGGCCGNCGCCGKKERRCHRRGSDSDD